MTEDGRTSPNLAFSGRRTKGNLLLLLLGRAKFRIEEGLEAVSMFGVMLFMLFTEPSR